ncbi:MAG TPA: rhodanese-like domain-containing protein [Anaerolineales bacterium]|nr:rhodanese-like domain-containing protein [Anaerolineales bacterium]
MVTLKPKPRVTATPAADPHAANAFFSAKLTYETDPSDVYADMKNELVDFVLIDVRSAADYAKSHAQGAINLPQVSINAETTSKLPKEKLLVVYCWGQPATARPKPQPNLALLAFTSKR